ncbi:MAG TPA: hypothetical protein VIJ94_01945 [Caulobacteraceae bacterium]
MLNDHSPISYWLANLAGAGSIVGAILGYTPALAALVALVWYLIQIVESKTVKGIIAGRRVRKLARLKAQAIMLEAKLAHPTTPSAVDPD